MKIYIEKQVTPIASEVTSLLSIIIPLLKGVLFSVKEDVVNEAKGYENVKLKMLPRIYRPGYGDIGLSFEWAVHDSIRNNNPLVMERIIDASRKCKLPGNAFESLLFSIEKSGKTRIIDTSIDMINEDSRLLTGAQAQPIKLYNYLNMLKASFTRPDTRKALPYSINGLWKADLFLGTSDTNRWVGTTLKIQPSQLEGARGLRIGIVPASQGKTDKIVKDESKNLVICPLPYDGSFMELFFTGWRIIQQFIAADAKLPKEAALPNPPERQVARELEMRREFSVLEVIEALKPQSQADLLESKEKIVNTSIKNDDPTEQGSSFNDAIITPVADLKNGA